MRPCPDNISHPVASPVLFSSDEKPQEKTWSRRATPGAREREMRWALPAGRFGLVPSAEPFEVERRAEGHVALRVLSLKECVELQSILHVVHKIDIFVDVQG